MLGEAQFVKHTNKKSQDKCLETQEIVRINDSVAQAMIREIRKYMIPTDFQAFPSGTRNRFLAELKAKELSVRQIERLTEINRGWCRWQSKRVKTPSP